MNRLTIIVLLAISVFAISCADLAPLKARMSAQETKIAQQASEISNLSADVSKLTQVNTELLDSSKGQTLEEIQNNKRLSQQYKNDTYSNKVSAENTLSDIQATDVKSEQIYEQQLARHQFLQRNDLIQKLQNDMSITQRKADTMYETSQDIMVANNNLRNGIQVQLREAQDALENVLNAASSVTSMQNTLNHMQSSLVGISSTLGSVDERSIENQSTLDWVKKELNRLERQMDRIKDKIDNDGGRRKP